MKIKFTGKHKSISGFESEELHPFTVITGKNGSGKTQLLEAIQLSKNAASGSQPFSVTLYPNPQTIHFSGLGNFPLGNVSLDTLQQPVSQILTTFNSLDARERKKILAPVFQKAVTIAELIENDWERIQEIFEATNDHEFYAKFSLAFTDHYHNPHDHENHKRIFVNYMTNNRKNLEAIFAVCELQQKDFLDLIEADFKEYTLHEKFLDNRHVFESKIELIFLAYAKRRFENDYKYYRKLNYADTNSAVSDTEFLAANPAPWDQLNQILADIKVDLQFVGIDPGAITNTTQYHLHFTKPSITDHITFATLSSGEKIIVGLVLGLFTSNYYDDLVMPDLIIFDEPDAHLHPELTQLLINVLHDTFVSKYGKHVIITTHSPSTVALSPEESLFQMENAPDTALKKISKDEALILLTGNIPTLSINYKNHRQVFVESITDLEYYQTIYSKYSSNEKLPHKLYFISGSRRGKTNSDWVTNMVQQIRNSGNTTAFGILDWDLKNPSTSYIPVHGEKQYYSLENVILLPLYVAVYFLSKNGAHNIYSELSFDASYNFYAIGEESPDRLQQISNWVISKVTTSNRGLNLSGTKRAVTFLNGKSIQIPVEFLDSQGHALQAYYKKAFNVLDPFIKEGDLQQHFSVLISRCYPLVTIETINTLRYLTS
ncbi:AAA family ATPase [Chitinophaga sp. YIM B06452]|uniref:AAA family ATPase n=1 Tax=Chitinophaga sp. YIM B06452 TaxID=3082158 RepID=UPI0031FE7187